MKNMTNLEIIETIFKHFNTETKKSHPELEQLLYRLVAMLSNKTTLEIKNFADTNSMCCTIKKTEVRQMFDGKFISEESFKKRVEGICFIENNIKRIVTIALSEK